jgi:lipopolysaccharide transport system permease protein
MNPHTLIIEPGLAERHYWRDLWRYRELFYVLAWRDLTVRYKQTLIGLAWALLRPFLTLVVFTLVFGTLAKMPSAGTAPYALLVFAGLLPWQFFATALTESSNSLIGNANLISKVYFPRLIVPAATIVVALVDFFISLAILVMVWYQFLPGWQILPLPILVLMAILGGGACLYWPGFLLSWGLIAGFFWLGIRQFRRLEKSFADLV